MAGPRSLDPRASHRSTRQLLDELDALMERMLNLPVEDGEGSPPPPEEPPVPTRGVSWTLLEPTGETMPADSPSPAPELYSTAILAAPPIPIEEAPPPAPTFVSAEELDRRGSDVAGPQCGVPSEIPCAERETVPTTVAAPDPSPTMNLLAPDNEAECEPVAPVPRPAYRRSPLHRRPYALFLRWNQRYDRATRRLGLLGRLLRSEAVRGFLGFVGLLLMIAALAWTLKDGMRWPW